MGCEGSRVEHQVEGELVVCVVEHDDELEYHLHCLDEQRDLTELDGGDLALQEPVFMC